jgi:hypothetical protein
MCCENLILYAVILVGYLIASLIYTVSLGVLAYTIVKGVKVSARACQTLRERWLLWLWR